MLTDFTRVFTEKFITDRKKTQWVREFNQLKQGKDTIEEYVDDFMRLLQKVDPTDAWTDEMKVRKFVDSLNHRIAPLIYMDGPNDLLEAIDYATRAYTGQEVYDKKNKEVGMAEQIEQLQAQIAELTLNSVNNVANLPLPVQQPIQNYYNQPPVNLWVQNVSQSLPPLNRPYEQGNSNNNDQQESRRFQGNCFNCGIQGHIFKDYRKPRNNNSRNNNRNNNRNNDNRGW